jgi:chitinase
MTLYRTHTLYLADGEKRLSIADKYRGAPWFEPPARMAMWGVLAVLPLVLAAGSAAQTGLPAQKVIAAYVFPQDRELQKDEIAAGKLTRINYAFANIKDGRIVNGFKHDDQNLATLLELKKVNPALSVLVSVGGWDWSGSFSDVALTRDSRAVFIESVAQYIEQHQLDGLDIDWEYPGQAGSSKHFRSQDKHNFTLLLKELRANFGQQQLRLHRPLYLTLAAGASSDYLEHTEMDAVQQYVDTVNLMAYDYYEPGRITGNHAPLFTDPDDLKRVSADSSVREFEQAGVPPEKIVLGVPFYGHIWGSVEDTKHGLFQAGKRTPQGYATYELIETTMLKNGFERYWDEASSVPYLYSPKQKVFVSYEDSESLAAKARYVMERRLAGIMFWDYAGDPTGVLLDTIYKGVAQQAPAKTPSSTPKAH